MYTLYYSPGAASFVVHWLLIETGAAHELVKLDTAAGEHKRAPYLSINPAGLIPTLMIDGSAYAETAALVMHLADAHPAARLSPIPEHALRARYYQWIAHCAGVLQPTFRHWFYPHEIAGEDNSARVKDTARERLETTFARIDAALAQTGPYLLGGGPSAADFYLTMLMRWSRNMPRPATQWKHLAHLAGLMRARPSFATLYEREGLTEWAA